MGYEDAEAGEKIKGGSKPRSDKMTLQKAIDLGEYDPEFLSTFPEWNKLSRHVQFQMIREALTNRHRHLITQWAEINNFLDFSLKPELRIALKNIEKQLKRLDHDREALFIEYSK